MFRNSYQKTSSSFAQNPYSVTSPSGFTQNRSPLYPVGPTLPRPEFKPVQTRGLSPSPYLNRQGMQPPSYEEKYLKRAETMAGQMNVSFEERQRRLIEQNEQEIQEQSKRREQIRRSYEREIDTISKQLQRNLESKQKLLSQIESLQQVHDETHEKLMGLQPPENNINTFEPIDRKQQEMIIMKNKLISQMREAELELNKKEEEEQKYWEEQIQEKQKYLFNLEQTVRDRRMELHTERQKSLEKPDFLIIEDEIRTESYEEFLHQYSQLEKKINRLIEERERSIRLTSDTIELKKPQLHNQNIRKRELKAEAVGLKLKIDEMSRIAKEMEGANENLMKELERKESMIERYELDIYGLREKKKEVEDQIGIMIKESKETEERISMLEGIEEETNRTQEEVRFYQSTNTKLKNQYQKLYEVLCSATSKHIHNTFNEVVSI